MVSTFLWTIRRGTYLCHRLVSRDTKTVMATVGSFANQSARWPSTRPDLATPNSNTFISLPIPSLLNGDLEKTLDMYRVVPLTPELMYKVVSDVESYDEFLPFCYRSTILRQQKHTFDAQLTVGFQVFQEKYTSRVRLDPEALIVKAHLLDSGLFSRMDSRWHLQRTSDPAHCRIAFHVEFSVKSPLHAATINTFFEDLSKQQMDAFVRRACVLYQNSIKS